jgi:hypothetical protein
MASWFNPRGIRRESDGTIAMDVGRHGVARERAADWWIAGLMGQRALSGMCAGVAKAGRAARRARVECGRKIGSQKSYPVSARGFFVVDLSVRIQRAQSLESNRKRGGA